MGRSERAKSVVKKEPTAEQIDKLLDVYNEMPTIKWFERATQELIIVEYWDKICKVIGDKTNEGDKQ